MFLPSSQPISVSSLKSLIEVHLDILNVKKETSYIAASLLRPSPSRRRSMEPEQIQIPIKVQGGYGMKSDAAIVPAIWKRQPKRDEEGMSDLLDFQHKEVQW